MSSIVKKICKFTKSEIDHLFSYARRVFKNESCTILRAPRQNKEFARVLIIASRKVGNAPERNLIRRRIKSIFYEEKLFSLFFDYVFIAHPKIKLLSFNALKQILLSVCEKDLAEK